MRFMQPWPERRAWSSGFSTNGSFTFPSHFSPPKPNASIPQADGGVPSSRQPDSPSDSPDFNIKPRSTIMPATIEEQPNHVYVMRFSGTLKRSEFGNTQTFAAREIDAGVNPRILALLENFEGWERGADWN